MGEYILSATPVLILASLLSTLLILEECFIGVIKSKIHGVVLLQLATAVGYILDQLGVMIIFFTQ